MPQSPFCVQVFSKCPGHGKPKTRLQPPLSSSQASHLHWQLTLNALSRAAAASTDVELWIDRPSVHPWVERATQQFGCSLEIQAGVGLGARMFHALQTGLSRFRYAVLIGSDCAVLSADHIHKAYDDLRAGADAVFVPATDGGYVLIAVSRLDASLFTDMDWGTDTVMSCSRERMRTLGWQWAEQDPLWDVDRPEDLQRLRDEGIELPSL